MKFNYKPFIIILIILGLLIITMETTKKKQEQLTLKGESSGERVLNEEFLVFERKTDWGPCPQGESCTERIILYKSGTLLKNFAQIRILTKKEVQEILDIIQKENLITLRCPSVSIQDMKRRYIVGVNEAETNTFENPSCEKLFKPIEEILGIYGDGNQTKISTSS